MKSQNDFYLDAEKAFSRYFKEQGGSSMNVNNLSQDQGFKGMMNASPVIFLIADLQVHQYVFISESVKCILGYSPEEFYSEGLIKTAKLFPGIHNEIVLNEIFPLMFDYFDRYSLLGEASDIKVSYTSLMLDSEGVSKWFLHEATIIQTDEFNKPHLMFKLLTNINDIKKDDTISFIINKKNSEGVYEKVYSKVFHPENSSEMLSGREVEILRLINEGKTSNEIGAILYLSAHTVKTHRKNMLKKLESKNTVGLLKKTKELGIIA